MAQTLICLNGNRRQERHTTDIRRMLIGLLSRPEFELTATERYARTLDTLMPEIATRIPVINPRHTHPDLMISIGGDGTLLKTAVIAAPLDIPVLGVNCGHLGYLTCHGVEQADSLVDGLLRNDYVFETRTMLRVSVPDAPHLTPHTPYALNEVAILKRDSASMINVITAIDNKPLTTFRADGLLISTPTGSTGYNLSAGGPIISPKAPVLCIAPVAPHSLSMRPLVIDRNSLITVTPVTRAETYLLALDGRSTPLPDGQTVEIAAAPFCLRLARRPDYTFADTLRTKLLWGQDSL